MKFTDLFLHVEWFFYLSLRNLIKIIYLRTQILIIAYSTDHQCK